METTGETLDLLAPARDVYSVSRLNREARDVIEQSLGSVWVEGELSNLAQPSSGHLYWTLKDGQAQVRCAMFRQYNRSLSFKPEDGQQVLLRGRVSLYEARGEFQIVADYLEEAGEGLLRRRFEVLKQKLKNEGLFEPEHKRPLPPLPGRIGVVTSATGAAVRDVIHVLGRRFPAADVLVYPTAVQGAGAAAEIASTLKLAERRADCDLLLLVRGGGSLEDLWSFNDEGLARTVFQLTTPVIAGVGHEVDFTIVDFVADVRAPTPSGAAELAVPDQAEWSRTLTSLSRRLGRTLPGLLAARSVSYQTLIKRLAATSPRVLTGQLSQRLDDLEGRILRARNIALGDCQARLAHLKSALAAQAPRAQIKALMGRFDQAGIDLGRGMTNWLDGQTARVALAARALDGLSPLSTLDRGYAIVTAGRDRSVITSAADIASGEVIDVRLARGALNAQVLEVSSSKPTDQEKKSATTGRKASISTRNES